MTTATTNPHLIYLLILIQMMSVNRMQVQKLLESISLEGEDERPGLGFRIKDLLESRMKRFWTVPFPN